MDNELMNLINNEQRGYEQIQKLRAAFSPELFDRVSVDTREAALDKGYKTLYEILRNFEDMNIDVYSIAPGHGIGHLARDCVYSFALAKSLDVAPKHLFVGIVAGTLHDMGCALVERYKESQKVVRHAEAGAFLLEQVFSCTPVTYAVAAHTHYLKPQEVKCSDGTSYKIEPYADLDKEGKPVFGVWLARWSDRLDVNGPCFPSRHYLTLAETHKDFSASAGFYDVDFASHMQPVLRSKDEIKAAGGKQTMLEHLNMFATSQSNESPYGKHDFGKMTELRDSLKERLFRIIKSVEKPETKFSSQEKDDILREWKHYLTKHVEPSPACEKVAGTLDQMFRSLNEETRNAWCNGFQNVMKEYNLLSQEILPEVDDRLHCLPVVGKHIREVFASSPAFESR